MPRFGKYWGCLLLSIGAMQMSYAQGDITNLEYFIDNGDLGVGLNTPIPITSGANVLESFVIPTSSLAVGFHTIYFRTQDVGGQWSVQNSRSFYISSSDLTTQANIVDIEYFIDADPGYGSATSLGPFSSTNININRVLPTSALGSGFHVLFIRALDSDGSWGDMEFRPFYISDSDLTTTANIVALRYYIDNDPGFGNGTLIPITTSTNIDISSLANTSALTPGHHVLNVRALDSDGQWSEISTRSFYVDAFASGLISGIEYFYNSDPGYGAATTLAITPSAANIDQVVNLATTSLPVGNHELGIRMINDNGVIGMTDYYSFNLCDGANAAFTSSSACVGSATNFTDTSTGTLTGDVYAWDFESDGIVDDNTEGNTSFTYSSTGVFTASLTIDRSGCKDSVAMIVNVESIPTADAGSDQNICTDNATLNATVANTNETGTWSILSGSGTFADVHDPATNFSGTTSNTNQLQWTLVNDLAGCTDADAVVISNNLPISTTSVAASASLGQTTNTDVQSVATINAGDVLTTSIIGQPNKGTASVLTTGTIDYTPNTGTVGMDTVYFSLCNQCNNCVDSFLAIDIQNNAPTINPGTLTVEPGGTISIDLLAITSDINNNLDASSLRIVQQPISGALASIDASFNLIVNYSGVVFVGTDEIGIEACDLVGECATSIIFIEVNLPGDPPITVYNAVSPNGDEKHDFLEIENIAAYQHNSITIFNRWGRKVFEGSPYDNDLVKFDGIGNVGGAKELPGGTYFYRLDLGNGTVATGFLVLKN